jgi:UDPglucose--hexose-1-phosphate uridylyltransferase
MGYWTIMATERGWRPMEYHAKKITTERPCPFCENHESETTSEVYAIRRPGTTPNGPGWQVRAIVSKIPILADGPNGNESHGQGIYDWRPGVGRHEIIIETPEHQHDLDELTAPAIQEVIRVYVQRFGELEKDERFTHALLFKNHGLVSGSAQDVIRHSRSQIIAMPITPKRAKEELVGAKNYFERRERCVFCDVLKQETSEGVRRVVENDSFLAFCPFASRSPFEMWILPKRHLADFGRLEAQCFPDLADVLKTCLSKLRSLLDDPPYNVILHSAPFRHKSKSGYWKTIDLDYHWYFQITPRLTHVAGFEWGTGIYINPTPPEEAAVLLREAVVSS